MTAIANSTSSCMRSFSRLIAALATGEQEHRESMPPEKIEIEHGRFKIWSGSLGALQSGPSSLDFRLRESSVMQTNVMKLLIKLDQTLQKSIQVAKGARTPLEKLLKSEYSSDESSEDESETRNEDRLIATELSQHTLTIMDILADLYKLSFRIRNPATRTRSLKPTLYKEVDKETKVDKFKEYANYDYSHVLESFKQLRKDAEKTSRTISESSKEERERMRLVDRLAITITKRRRVLRYWQRHAKKLSDAPGAPKGGTKAVPALPQSSSVSMGATADLNAGQFLLQRLQPAVHIAAPSLVEQSILSGTEATRYDRKIDDSLDTQSVISYASTAFDVHGNTVDLPPAPVAASRGSEFVCCYCGIVCPSRYGKDRAWRDHVLHDLQPYICTYPECSDAFQMYSSRHIWLEHERLVHRRIWQCFDHANAVFALSAELRDHLKSEHSEGVTEDQIQNLLDVCESSVEDIRTKCPICLEEGPFEKGLHNHLSFHLETFATFSIPRGIFSGEESESRAEGNSGKAQGLRSETSTKPTSLRFQSPPASISSYANKEPEDETRPEQIASTLPDEAKKVYRRALRGEEKARGPEHTLELKTINKSGSLYKDEGGLDEAEKMYRRELQEKEKAWGPEHTSTLDTVSKLGLLYANQGKLDEAEKMYRRALHGYEKAWGPEHTSTLATVNNLGLLYIDQGKLDEAEKMYRRALQGKEKAWGPEHISTLNTVNNLGLLYAEQGKLDEAEKMYRRALHGYEKARALGPEYTSTLDTVNNLGLLYAEQGKLDEAEKMYRRALQGKEKVFGAEHTSTLDTVSNLGLLHADQGKLDQAEKMYRRALHGYEKACGAEHVLTLDTVNNLGLLYADHGKLDQAEKMYQRALHGYEKAWGPEHTLTLATVNNLGLLYADQGKLDEAEKMYRRALQGKEKALGPDNTSTLNTVNNLGLLHAEQGKLDQAEKMYQRALQGYEKALGRERVKTYTPALNIMQNLAALYKKSGRANKAKDMYSRALDGVEAVLGSSSKQRQDIITALGILRDDEDDSTDV